MKGIFAKDLINGQLIEVYGAGTSISSGEKTGLRLCEYPDVFIVTEVSVNNGSMKEISIVILRASSPEMIIIIFIYLPKVSSHAYESFAFPDRYVINPV